MSGAPVFPDVHPVLGISLVYYAEPGEIERRAQEPFLPENPPCILPPPLPPGVHWLNGPNIMPAGATPPASPSTPVLPHVTADDLRRARIVGRRVIVALAALGLALALCGPAMAHEWFDPWCCNGRDCQPIPDSAVQITPQGYVITLRPGDHPMLAKETETRTYRVPYDKARVSLDPEQRFFACIYPDPSSMRCFYARPSGS